MVTYTESNAVKFNVAAEHRREKIISKYLAIVVNELNFNKPYFIRIDLQDFTGKYKNLYIPHKNSKFFEQWYYNIKKGDFLEVTVYGHDDECEPPTHLKLVSGGEIEDKYFLWKV